MLTDIILSYKNIVQVDWNSIRRTGRVFVRISHNKQLYQTKNDNIIGQTGLWRLNVLILVSYVVFKPYNKMVYYVNIMLSG